jgi:formylglycine-generating enzyme required for sulfatase activity
MRLPFAIVPFLLLVSAGATAKEPRAEARPESAPAVVTVTGPAKMDTKTGLLFVWMPPGDLIFGCDAGTGCTETRGPGRNDPPTTARTPMPGFWWMRGRATNAEYAACVAAGACTPQESHQFCLISGPSYPATCVSYPQAEAFCSWIEARLPTAMEWEYAVDRGYDPLWEFGANFNGHSHGAMEWVKSSGPSPAAPGYEPIRGGVADLEPVWPSDEGHALAGSQFREIGFRCVQTATS